MSSMPIRPVRFALVFLLTAAAAHAQPTPRAPRTGADVLARMHAAYDGRWYHTLTFTQKTTIYRPGTAPIIETWYESLRHTPATGVQLRIDRGAPAAGNGTLYTSDSTWVIRGGTVVSKRGEGNEFLPLIEGVYVQPVATTVKQVQAMHVDLAKVRADTWASRRAWVVGAAAGDSTSAQFWVDAERNVVVRMILPGPPNQPSLDIVLGGYERTGGGWLATKVTMSAGGMPRQAEVYSDWKVDVPLAPALFDPANWTTAPHWVR
jgi:hypothetical protein